MLRGNRHQITEFGWMHIQDNKKILLNNDENLLVAEEKGINTYRKVNDKKCSLAVSWWNENKDKWSSIRNNWSIIFNKKKDLNLRDKVDGMRLYEYLLFTDQYNSKDKHEDLINSFIVN